MAGSGVKDAVQRLARARERALAGAAAPGVRAPVRESWARSARVGLDPDRHLPPIALGARDVADLRDGHPLASVWARLADALAAPEHVLFVADAAGRLLWVEGDRRALRRAEDAHLVPGAGWSEAGAGTNGVGTALALGRPFCVFGPEHFLARATGYVCAAAPIRDALGRIVGAVDVTGDVRRMRPDTLRTVVLAARLAEAALREQAQRRLLRLAAAHADRLARRAGTRSAVVTDDGEVVQSSPARWLPRQLGAGLVEGAAFLPDGRPVIVERIAPRGPLFVMERRAAEIAPVALSALGRDRALLRVDGVTHALTRRHSELVALLAGTPSGLTGAQLATALGAPADRAATARAELARLRPLLGYRLLSDPYRLAADADFVALERDAGALSPGELLDRYPGPLLPGSRAPAIVARRRALHECVRARVLAAGDPDALRRWQAQP